MSASLENILGRRQILVVSQTVSSIVPQSIIDDFGGDDGSHQLVVSQTVSATRER